MSIVSAAFLLFLVMDPLGNVPFFISVLSNVAPERRRRIIVREMIIALVILLFFLFMGRFILDLLQLSEPSLSLAGGIILFLIALRMIFPPTTGIFGEDSESGEPLVFPLAVPLVAGPSSMTTVILLMTREPELWWQWLIAIIVAWLASAVILLLSNNISRFVGEKGLHAMERLMGMILTTIAVQMFLTGIESFWHAIE